MFCEKIYMLLRKIYVFNEKNMHLMKKYLYLMKKDIFNAKNMHSMKKIFAFNGKIYIQ